MTNEFGNHLGDLVFMYRVGLIGTVVGWYRTTSIIKGTLEISYDVSYETPDFFPHIGTPIAEIITTRSKSKFNECDLLPIGNQLEKETDQAWKEVAKLATEKFLTGTFVITPNKPVCECGKEKHGFANHSNWCGVEG